VENRHVTKAALARRTPYARPLTRVLGDLVTDMRHPMPHVRYRTACPMDDVLASPASSISHPPGRIACTEQKPANDGQEQEEH
jgi:hypothetical protein